MEKNSKIYIAGHTGLVGSAILRNLKSNGYNNLLIRKHRELDLTRQADVEYFFNDEKPEYVFLTAAKTGGIMATNKVPAEFIYTDTMIQYNVINAAYKTEVKGMFIPGSSCIYPRTTPLPIKEEYLLTSALEKTNEAFAIAKIAGVKMCEYYNKQYGTNYIACMATNIYGLNDNYDIENSRVLPAVIRKVHEAKKKNQNYITIWGTGSPLREFLYADDMADAAVYLMNNYSSKELINIGTGEEISIINLYKLVCKVIGYDGEIVHDLTKPDGTPRKLLDSTRLLSLGWKPKVSLEEGIKRVYEDFISNL